MRWVLHRQRNNSTRPRDLDLGSDIDHTLLTPETTAAQIAQLCAMGVKAAGVRTYRDAINMIEAGTTRIGANASIKIIQAAKALVMNNDRRTNLHGAWKAYMRTCGYCHIGHLRRTHTTYMNWHSGRLVTVPNMPVWLCDVCAHCEVDADAINHLMPLLGPVTRPDPTQPRRAHHPLVGDAARPEFDSDHGRV